MDISRAQRITIQTALTSVALGAVKIVAGVFGNSYALVADGIESLTDVGASVAVLIGLTYSIKPPDEGHPYGHGKLETFASLFVGAMLLAAAAVIAWQSVGEIANPQGVPAWFTLPILVLVIVVKIAVSRAILREGEQHGSEAMKADSWHHFSDALTSGAAFIGISIAMLGGEAYAAADDWAALIACGIILYNGIRIAHGSLSELMESAASAELDGKLRELAAGIPGVHRVEKMRVRKSGLVYLMDIHIWVDPGITVYAGHEIAKDVKRAILDGGLQVVDVTVHVEPDEA